MPLPGLARSGILIKGHCVFNTQPSGSLLLHESHGLLAFLYFYNDRVSTCRQVRYIYIIGTYTTNYLLAQEVQYLESLHWSSALDRKHLRSWVRVNAGFDLRVEVVYRYSHVADDDTT